MFTIFLFLSICVKNIYINPKFCEYIVYNIIKYLYKFQVIWLSIGWEIIKKWRFPKHPDGFDYHCTSY